MLKIVHKHTELWSKFRYVPICAQWVSEGKMSLMSSMNSSLFTTTSFYRQVLFQDFAIGKLPRYIG